ncbi:MAG: hypothetical protein AB7V36_13025, partial [Bacteroidales bacterium]
NANDFKRLRVLNPALLNDAQASEILKAYSPLKQRTINTIFEEIEMEDRINFDRTILKCFGIEETLLESLYSTLAAAVNDRVSMRDR